MTRIRKRLLTIAAVLVGGLAILALGAYIYIVRQPLPPPQIASFAGTSVPDFTLTDQNGQTFHLAEHRGHPVVLYFYRGYW